ncbi:hypothetical protein FACS189454_01810 [Planctomycetales bacterium]|nr:hypothetical protein FACS189454_01810 [Planctomycetales bacterium]
MTLPLTVFEKYMFFDDRPEYPMDSFRLLRFSGELDLDVFHVSIQAVAVHHPLLRSIVKKIGRRNYAWQEVDVPVAVKHDSEHETPIPERINLETAPGFRVYIATGKKNAAAVLFQFHHSVSDGLGEMEVIGEILTDYAARIGHQTPPPIHRDASLLAIRGKTGLTLKSYLKNYFHTAITTRQLLFGKPDPLRSYDPAKITAIDNYFAFQTRELSESETKRFFSKAKQREVTVNDYLLTICFQTMNAWREHWVQPPGNPKYRLAVPMNLRTEKHKNIPASNTVTMLFLDRRHQQCGQETPLLQSVSREMNWAKRTEQKHYLISGLWIRDCLPGGIAPMMRTNQCRSTVVLSNLGRVFEDLRLPSREDGKLIVGGAVLEEVNAAPPIRPGTFISMSVLTYANRLRLILRYDSQTMSGEQADDFLKRFSDLLVGIN